MLESRWLEKPAEGMLPAGEEAGGCGAYRRERRAAAGRLKLKHVTVAFILRNKRAAMLLRAEDNHD